MGLLARIRGLSGGDRRLLAEALVALGCAALVVAFCPFRRVTDLVRLPTRAMADDDSQRIAIERVRWAVQACSRRVPWRAKCLEQALAAQWLLNRRSVPAVIHYGIANGIDGLAAHAWVSVKSIQVIGFENACEFSEIAQFPSPDRLDATVRRNVRLALLRRPRL